MLRQQRVEYGDGRGDIVGDLAQCHPVETPGVQRGGQRAIVGTSDLPFAKRCTHIHQLIAGRNDGHRWHDGHLDVGNTICRKHRHFRRPNAYAWIQQQCVLQAVGAAWMNELALRRLIAFGQYIAIAIAPRLLDRNDAITAVRHYRAGGHFDAATLIDERLRRHAGQLQTA